jgi:hypothetical protein
MADQPFPGGEETAACTMEELRQQYQIVDTRIPVLNLCEGMVCQIRGKLRLVSSVRYESTESGPVAVIKTLLDVEKLASDSQIDVWYADGEPFLLPASPEEFAPCLPAADGGGSAPPTQDAAGIVPVWRGPKRLT